MSMSMPGVYVRHEHEHEHKYEQDHDPKKRKVFFLISDYSDIEMVQYRNE